MVPLPGMRSAPGDLAEGMEEILRDCPDFYPALFQLGVLRAAGGRSEEARRLLLDGADRLAEREPVLSDDLDLTGGVSEPLQEVLCHDLAREVLERLTEHYPSDASLHDELGSVLVFLGELDEAVRRFETAIALEPDDARLLCNLGWGLLAAGRLDEATAQLERSQKLNPRDPITRGNLEVARFLKRKGGRFEDVYLRPIDRKRFARLVNRAAEEGDSEELDRYVDQVNFDRLEGWKWRLCRRREPPGYQELFKSLRAFFRFVESISQDSYTLYEDLSLLSGRFRRVMHKFLFKMADADVEILEEIFAALLSFYGYLTEGGLVEEDDFADFRAEILEAQPDLVEKAERYAEVRHDPAIPEEELDCIREELFEGDHVWPLL
ncbi:MAG TPA: tetratricopeptide repeat protein [Thermoanaerobaculia bacterium]|nr:tetratricopeptide repeat protein [Thermoanaerobaculia bacterium]